jgi:hypothetical protein
LKLDGTGCLGPLVDAFLTAVQCTFTLSLHPQSPTAKRTPVLFVEPFVQGSQGDVSAIDVGAIGFIGNRFDICAPDHARLIHQDLRALRVGGLFHDCH